MFKRFFRYIRALFMGKLDQWEDPEVILNESLREMRENQVKNRERAVQALTQKNNLQNLVSQEEKLTANLESKAVLALKQGNEELARQLLREKGTHDSTLKQLRESLQQAEQTTEAVKLAIQREEESFRRKTAEALALKANMKQAQIQIEITKALDTFQSDDSGQSWTRAEERIRNMQSEAQARGEIASTSVNSRLAQLETDQVDVEADKALQDLKVKMGMAPPVVQETEPAVQAAPAPKVNENEIDQQLAALEQKINQANS
jgi:phage shock protein A